MIDIINKNNDEKKHNNNSNNNTIIITNKNVLKIKDITTIAINKNT